jgi:aquaporin Z
MAAYTTIQKLIAEFIGVFFLVFTWCSVSMAGGPMGAFAVASALMIGVYNLASISGAHLNPAVSLGVYRGTGMTPALLGLYWLVQFAAGGIAAISSGYTYNTQFGGASSMNIATNTTMTPWAHMNALGPGSKNYDSWSVGISEMVYTFLLVFVVLNVAVSKDVAPPERNNYFGLAIGFVIIAGAMSIGSITQCSLNPAVSFGATIGAQLFGDGGDWMYFFIYTLAEFLGALLAFGLHHVVRNFGKPKTTKSSLVSECVAEFLGTFILVLTVSLVVLAPTDALKVVGIACSLMVMIYALGSVSGGQFNPAVSTGLLLIKKIDVKTYGAYVATQLVGGFFAVLTTWLIRHNEPDGYAISLVDKRIGARPTAAKGSWGMIASSEILFTFLLVFTVLNVAVADAGNQYYGLAIGFVIVAGGTAVGSLSGGMFNPAVAISIDLGDLMNTHTNGTFGYSFVYAGFELVGAGLAAAAYHVLRNPSGSDDDYAAEKEETSGDSDDA